MHGADPAPEAAVFTFNILSATGTAILLAALIGGFVLRYSFGGMMRVYWRTSRWRGGCLHGSH